MAAPPPDQSTPATALASPLPGAPGSPAAEEAGEVLRHPRGWQGWLVPMVALAWSLFQLSIASWLTLDNLLVRAVHLALALMLAYWAWPALRPGGTWLTALRVTDRLPWLDLVLGLLAAGAAAYLVLDYAGIVARPGNPLPRDLIAGLALVLLLLEGARRAIGPAISVVALGFSLYCFVSEWLPTVLATKQVSLNRFISQITMGAEGIYGTPLDVSARVVFLFVLLGAVLDRAGAGRFFIELALSLLGGMRGGPAKAAVVGSGLTGLVSGSSIANIVTTGTFTIPLMKRVGYPAHKAAAVEVAASTDGQLMPPIMGAAAFIIADTLGISYFEVVKAAIVPALVSYVTLFWIVHVEATKLGLRGLTAAERPAFWATLRAGWWHLVPVLVLLVLLLGVVGERRSPEYAAFWAIVAAMGMLVLGNLWPACRGRASWRAALVLGGRELAAALAGGARQMVPVALATAAAGIIVGVVTLGLGGIIAQVITMLAGGEVWLLLGLTALASLIVGMGLPTTATYIVIAALTAPVIVTVGAQHGLIVPLLAAHMFCFYFGILADDTPPVGLAAYTAAAIARCSPIKTGLQSFMYDIRTAILPFMFIFNHDLLLLGIQRWDQGLLVLLMAILGCCAFASITQGWIIGPLHWSHWPLLALLTLAGLRPELLAGWLGWPASQRYWIYLGGILLASAILWHQRRSQRPVIPATV